MHGLISAADGWTYGASILTFAFPMILFIAVASALYVLYTKPHLVPGHRYRLDGRATVATPPVSPPGQATGQAQASGQAGSAGAGEGATGPAEGSAGAASGSAGAAGESAAAGEGTASSGEGSVGASGQDEPGGQVR